ncbi:hypothetical protein TNCV_1387901 [Trichonephila clavipes]|nr:hypothetical protein TNCV_1387901 [Trichonephila clavipes]
MDDLRVVYVKVKGEQEMVNAVIDTGAQMPVVRPDVVEGQSINNRGSIQITSAFGEHEMGEVKDSNMELNDFRHGVVPVSKNLVNDMLICSSDYEVLIENSQMIRNPAKLREPSKEEGIISSTDLKSVCSEEVITNLRPETYTQSLLNVPNGDLVAVKINASNVQTNGQGLCRLVAFCDVPRNFEPWSSDEQDTEAGVLPSPYFHTNRKTFVNLDTFNVHQPLLYGGSSAELDSNS